MVNTALAWSLSTPSRFDGYPSPSRSDWRGFVNHSFSVDDGCLRYHLKITDDPHSISKLQDWRKIHSLLERRYRAPELIDWLDFPEIGFAGLLLQQVDGRIANFCDRPALVDQLIELADRLHNDADIRSRLIARESPKTYFDHFRPTGKIRPNLRASARAW